MAGWPKYPSHLAMRNGKAVPRAKAGDLPAPDFQRELNVSASLDESAIEDTLLPAARRRLAETRLQMLSTMVLMGINRIVVTGGRIRATMGFHIDTSDSAFDRTAEDIDARVAMRGHVNALMWGVEASASLAYVSSKRAGSDAEMNVETDLTGEVELNFKSDYFPAERFATQGVLSTISNNTGVPSANPPPMAPAAAPAPRQPRRARGAAGVAADASAASAPLQPAAPAEVGTLDPAAKRKAAPAAGSTKSLQEREHDHAASALPGPFDTAPEARGMRVRPASPRWCTVRSGAARGEPAFYGLEEKRQSISHDLEKIAAYTAALVHEEWTQSRRSASGRCCVSRPPRRHPTSPIPGRQAPRRRRPWPRR